MVTKRHRHGQSFSWHSDQVFAQLVAECAALYADTPRVLSRFNIVPGAVNQRDVNIVHDPEFGMGLQTIEYRIFPFTYEDTAVEHWCVFPHFPVCRTKQYQVWICLLFLCVAVALAVTTDCGLQVVEVSEHTRTLEFSIGFAVGSKRCAFSVKMANCRYFEANRTVITFTSMVQPSAISDTNMDGVIMRHCGWYVIEPMLVANPTGRTRTASTVKAFHVTSCEVHASSSEHIHKVGTLMTFLLNAVSLELGERDQLLENRLLQRAINHDRR
jgi:hypothetical protein